MKILITGASSGIGRSLAVQLAAEGHEIVAVGRNEERLAALRAEIGCRTVATDLAVEENCFALYKTVGAVDFFINNAGYGDLGRFDETDLKKELGIIDTNIRAMHILCKLYYKDMAARHAGGILNVGSIAGFFPGPNMATYYASKAYVVRLSRALRHEAKAAKNGVYIGVLCPGPVNTRFNEVAGAKFAVSGADCDRVAAYTIRMMKKKKGVILPTFIVKLGRLAAKLAPEALSAACVAQVQKKRLKDGEA